MNKLKFNPIEHEDLQTLEQLFSEKASNNPNKTAVIYNGNKLTYNEIDMQSNQMARMLIKYGVGKNDIVGIHLPRSPEFIIAVLGVLKAKAVCMPIAKSSPEERVQKMMEDSAASFIVSNTSFNFEKVIYMEYAQKSFYSGEPLFIKDSSDMSHVIYTSGSTGNPKGVLLSHESLLNQIYAKIRMLSINQDDMVCFNLETGFIASIWQIFAPLITHATIVIFPENEGDFFHFIEQEYVTIVEITPTLLGTHFYMNPNYIFDKTRLRALILTGEQVNKQLVEKYYQNNKVPLYNTYGMTECSDDIIQGRINTNEEDDIPLGCSIQNVELYILTEKLQTCLPGEIGELYVSGRALAEGYLNDPYLTHQNFFRCYPKFPGKIYKTGDFIKMINGNIYYHGRNDHQVKLRGYRVNIIEVEKALNEIHSVFDAVVAIDNSDPIHIQMIAFVVAEGSVTTEKVFERIREKVPPYMVPQEIIMVDYLPVNQNGKIDRAMVNSWISEKKFRLTTSDDIAEKLKNIWKEVLESDEAGVNDNFFDAGGNSLLALVLTNKIQKQITSDIKLKDIVDHASMSEILEIIELYEKDKKT